ncbi:MAG: hypothetical protein OXG47_03935 [bacterium]|nr:hypothetical protein [bacterium]MCY3924706.1 hypothetical protein [bacterium]
MIADSIIAHQGGWDEILIIIGPLAVIVWIVALVRHRMRRETDAAAEEAEAEAGSGADAQATG